MSCFNLRLCTAGILLLICLTDGFAERSVQAQGNLPSPLEVQRKRQQEQGATGQTNPAQAAQKAKQRILASASLFLNLDNLIPGELTEGTDLEKDIRKVIDSFLDSKFEQATEKLDEVAKREKEFPPVDLLMAGMWYVVNKPQQGLAALEKSSVENPKYPGVFGAFARLAIRQNRLTDAQALLEKMKRLLDGGEFSEVEKEHFQSVYLDAMIDLFMRRKDYVAAREYVVKAQEADPESSKALSTLAELEFQDGRVEKSLELLNKLRESLPNTRAPELIVAQWYERKKDDGNNEKYIRLAAEKYPDDRTVQLQFANFSINKEDFKSAQSALDRIVKEEKDETLDSLSFKGKIAFANEAYGLAALHYEKLSRAAPNNFDILNMYALALAESDKEDEKKKAYAIALRNFQQLPNNPVAISALGWISWKTGNKNQAQQLLQRAAQTSRGLAPEIAFFLATMLHSEQNSQQAKLILGPALESKGFFYYRNPAKRLMKEIDASSLPSPKK